MSRDYQPTQCSERQRERGMEGVSWGWWVSVADVITAEGPGDNTLFTTLCLVFEASAHIVYFYFHSCLMTLTLLLPISQGRKSRPREVPFLAQHHPARMAVSLKTSATTCDRNLAPSRSQINENSLLMEPLKTARSKSPCYDSSNSCLLSVTIGS